MPRIEDDISAPPGSKEKPLSDRVNAELFAKKDRILEIRNEVMRQGREGKRGVEKEWYRNILLFVGLQWIAWNSSQKKWSTDIPGLGKWYPKPVTNKFAESGNALKSLLTEKQVRPIVTPGTDSEEDIATAQRGATWVDIINTEAETEAADAMAASWIVITGNCFYHNFYFTSKDNGNIRFNLHTCMTCQQKSNALEIEENDKTCPKCGTGKEFEQMVGQDGQPEGFTMPKGRLKEEACSPFEMFFNGNVDNFESVKQVIRAKSVPISEIENTYPEIKDKVSDATAGGDMSDTYKKALKTVTQSTMGGAGGSGDGNSAPECDVHYLFCKPDNEFKEGLMAVIVGENIVELETAEEYTDNDGVCFSPFDHAGCNYVPGRFWHKTRMDDIAQLQMDRNLFKSWIHLQTLTMSSGKWLDPGTNMDTPTGESGQVIKFDYSTEGRKPEMVPGIPVPAVMVELIKLIDSEIESLTATYDVIKGQLPAGLDTFSGLRLLTERAFSVHGEMIKNWARASVSRMKKKLELARKNWIEPRNKTVEGESGGFETQSFRGADLMGGVDIKVEEGSSIPRSQSVENAAIVESIKANLIDITNPKVRYKVLEKLGQQDLADISGDDIKDAAKEWREFLDSVAKNPENPEAWMTRYRMGIDNDAIHYQDASARAKTDVFWKLPPEARKLWVDHTILHKANLDAQMAQQAMTKEPVGT